jgi:hypothetical protein
MDMTVTYKELDGFPGVQTPVLHRVVYAHTVDGVPAKYQQSYKDYQVFEWLEANCKGNYYRSPGWNMEKSIEFEDDEDATLFALRWT